MQPRELKRRQKEQRNKMNEITAQLNSYRQSPRKVRLVANAIKGKSAKEAKNRLADLNVSNLLEIEIEDEALEDEEKLEAEAEIEDGLTEVEFEISTVNGGKILYRRRPVSHGSAHAIHKRTSHVTIVLQEKLQKGKIEKSKNKTK
ncbi:MAG: 50S ribosomal protein L22 [Parcubacteria group bacterium GW2011_GWA1_38_7]|nr:MAG: 50S ribosomal protein L22 [Parcubacteria group bacterium GW2011_GWA1_38_7]